MHGQKVPKSTDPQALRVHEDGNLNLVLGPSTIRHPDALLGVFVGEAISKGTIIGHYYGSLAFGDLNCQLRLHKTYGTGFLAVTFQDYNKWALNIRNTFHDADSTLSDGWVFGTPFCVCRCINDPIYSPGEKSEKLPEYKKRKPNLTVLKL